MNSGMNRRKTVTEASPVTTTRLDDYEIIHYPCCPEEKVICEKGAHGWVSQKCPRCKKYVLFDYDTKTAIISSAMRGAMNGHHT